MNCKLKLSTKFLPLINKINFPRLLGHQQNIVVEENNQTLQNISENSEDDPESKLSKINKILEPCQEDLTHITPNLPPTFNYASYINKSVILQELFKLGVNLYKLEKKQDVFDIILRLDFERDIKNYISLLNESGLPLDRMGEFLTKNPYIFQESLEDIKTRINYLEYKRFSSNMISRIITENPIWLNHSTSSIDSKLGFIQKKFYLTGSEVRSVTYKYPKLITYHPRNIETNTFVIKEELGFNEKEIKLLLLNKPKLWTLGQNNLISRFDYIHNNMGISHEQILSQPQGLLCRKFRIKQRHEFLKYLGRAQYDPTKEGYISIERIVSGSDREFAINVAKSSEYSFETFLKTI